MVDKYILVSLDEKKSKDIANVISNDTSRKILDYLGDHEKVAPVNLSKALSVPISTITYNLKQLKQQGLIEIKDYAWSDKGNKVKLYSLAKKLIIIAPKGFDWKETIKKIIPVALIGVVGTALLTMFQPITKSLTESSQAMLAVEEVAEDVAMETTFAATNEITQTVAYSYWLYFLILVCITIITIIFLDYRRSRK